MNIIERLNQDFISSVKAHETFAVSVLRMLRAALKNTEIEKRVDKQAELNEDEVIVVLNKELKKLKDAQDLFAQGGREDLVQKSKQEIEIVERYLPKQLGHDELCEEVKKVIAQMGDVTMADFGRVMSEVMKVVKGRVDGGQVSATVKECLK